MDVDATSYAHHLLGMLIAISEADFVSFDLELSGIPSRMPGKPRSRGRQTIEDRYLEVKAGAEKYQILQVGLTCARFDYLANKYVLRPYNINISPLLDERLDIEREVSFQTGAVEFLLKNNFQIDLPFTRGVQYLSREEANQAKQMAYDRVDKKNIVEDLQLRDTDVDSLDFVRRVREAVTKWKASNGLSLEITTHTGLKEQPIVPVISRFEKRLVHQLVRAEFPDLVSIGRSDCIKIIDYDADREAENKRRMKSRVKEQIVKQTGFRWIIEALCGGSIDSIDPMCFAKNPQGMVIAANLDAIKGRFDRARMRLKDNQAVLVGHNMFTDLVYFYRTFIGQLPETLTEFCSAIHELFPRIVDTKYLATYNGGDLNASPTLQEIAENLEAQPLPDIVTHSAHPKYHDTQAFHEAGYDSLLTATIMLRLSTKLDALEPRTETRSIQDTNKKTSADQNSALLASHEQVHKSIKIPPAGESHNKPTLHAQPNGIEVDAFSSPIKKGKKKRKKRGGATHKSVEHRFATKNSFAALRIGDQSPENEEPTDEGVEGEGFEHIKGAWADETVTEPVSHPIDMLERQPMEIAPHFESDFWLKFGNKLRIFGTQETVLSIAPWKISEKLK